MSEKTSSRFIIAQTLNFIAGLTFGGIIFGGISLEYDGSEHMMKYTSKDMFVNMQRQLYDIAIQPASNNTSRKQYDSRLGHVEPTGGGLHDKDRELIGKLYYNISSLLEFGLGESTMIAAHVDMPRYAGVDSDPVWVAKARDKSPPHFRFYFADISKIKRWGYPIDTTLRKIPYNYQMSALSSEMEPFDFYLIDGRYRVACACASMLHAISLGGDMRRIMFGVHDWIGREYYHSILEVAEIVHFNFQDDNNSTKNEFEADLLRVFKVKSNVTESDIYTLWQRHIWDEKR